MKVAAIAGLFFICAKITAQDTMAVFSRSGLDRGVHIHQTGQGNFIGTGITTIGRNTQALVLCYDRNLKLIWERSFGGNGYDFVWGIADAPGNGLIITGFSNSEGSGAFDAWIIRLNDKGDTLWSKTIGGAGDDRLVSVIASSDGTYLAVGQTASWGNGGNDVLLARFSGTGEIIWKKTYGGEKSDRGFYLVEFSNGDILLNGISENNSNNDVDALLIRTDKNGEEIWSRTYGSKGADVGHSLMLNGSTAIVGGYREYSPGMHKPWVFHVNNEGTIIQEDLYDVQADMRIIGAYLDPKQNLIATGYTRVAEGADWNMFTLKLGKDRKFHTQISSMPAEDQAYGICRLGENISLAIGHSYSTRNKDGDLVIWKLMH